MDPAARRTGLALAALLATLAGCEALFGLGGLTGGSPDSGADAAPDGCDCLPPVPGGWTLVAFGTATAAPCPDGYGDASSVVIDPSLDPATCTCACAVGTPPSCYRGTISYTAAEDPACDVGDGSLGGTGAYDPADGGCVSGGFGQIAPYHSVVPLPPSGGSCVANISKTLPSAGASGRVCALDPSSDTCAVEGGACAPAVDAPFALCIAHDGSVPCPPGFATAHAAGSSLVDTRGCGACSCGSPTCSATFSWYADTACASLVASVPADGNCHATPPADASNYRYAATPQACDAPDAQPLLTGNASLAAPQTVCCR